MLRHQAGFKFVDGGMHAQVFDFPAVVTCMHDLEKLVKARIAEIQG